MSEQKENYVIEERKCKDPKCGKFFDAKVYNLCGVTYTLGAGYCPACRRRLAAEDKAGQAREEKKARESREALIKETRKLWLKSCGIPDHFQKSTFDNFDAKRNGMECDLVEKFKVCESYADNFRHTKYQSLLLFSEHSWGVGKTHLVCAIAHRIIDNWNGESLTCPVRFVSEPDLYNEIQTTYRNGFKGTKSEASIIKELVTIPLLILDDVGKREVAKDGKPFVQRIMFSIIDGRYRANLPLVLTANLEPIKLQAYLGGELKDRASIDRLSEMCQKFYQIEGESYRWGKKV